MSQKTNPRQKLLVIGAAVAVLLYVADGIYGAVSASWSARSKEIAKLRQDVDKGRGSIERGPRTQATWADMEKNALPKDPAQAEQELITAFDKWGRANNVELASIKPQWKRGSNERYSLLECRIDATGTNCVPADASIVDGGTDANTDAHVPCNGMCSGATPHCLAMGSTETCVGCTAEGDCSGSTPHCDTTGSHTCVACLSDMQCPTAATAATAMPTSSSCASSRPSARTTPSSRRSRPTTGPGSTRRASGSSTPSTARASTARVAPTGPCTSRSRSTACPRWARSHSRPSGSCSPPNRHRPSPLRTRAPRASS